MLSRVTYLCIRYSKKISILFNVFRILYTNLTRIFPITKVPKYKDAPPLKQQILVLYSFKTQNRNHEKFQFVFGPQCTVSSALSSIKDMSYPYRTGHEP